MGTDKIYRWNRRQKFKSKSNRYVLFLETFDFVILILIFVVSFLSLRLLFIFGVVNTPCVEMFVTIGRVGVNPSAFTLTYFISLLMGVYWAFVTVDRILKGRKSWGFISWHAMMFMCIFLLAMFNRSLTSQDYMAPPDGTIIIETMHEPYWTDYKNGIWYVLGDRGCVWLDRNEIGHNDVNNSPNFLSLKNILGLGHTHMDLLADRQTYRPLTKLERERFLTKQACLKDLSHYGQNREICGPDYSYPMPEGSVPPQKF